MLTSNVRVFIQFQLVMMVSSPSFRYRNRGSKLTKKASFTAVLTWATDQSEARGLGESVVNRG